MGKERQKKSLFLSRALFGILALFLLIALVVGIVSLHERAAVSGGKQSADRNHESVV